MRDLDPGQNEKPGIVGKQADVLPAGLPRPADETVPRSQVARRRGPGEPGNGPILCIDQVFQVLAYRLGVTEVVVGLEQGVKEFLFRSAADLSDSEGFELGEPGT